MELVGCRALPSALQISAVYSGEIARTNRKLKLPQTRKDELKAALSGIEKPPSSDQASDDTAAV